jgi:poly-D-alanine transfer protein DltD
MVPPTSAMADMMVDIIVEVLDILGTATKEMKRSRARKSMRRLRSLNAHVCVEKLLKKIAGIRKLEDGLKTLDKMTNEESRMANAEAIRLAHGLNTKMECVDENVQGVYKNVKVVEEKVQPIIDGA